MVCRKAKPWYGKWSRDDREIPTEIADAIWKIREEALVSDCLPKFKGAVIRSSLSLLKSNRALALDNTSGSDFKELPEAAFDDLGLVYDRVAEEGERPIWITQSSPIAPICFVRFVHNPTV